MRHDARPVSRARVNLRTRAALACGLLAVPLFAQERVAPEALIEQLREPAQHDEARRQLVARGREAAPAVAAALRKAWGEGLDDLLGILTEIGPDAGVAFPQVEDVIEQGGCDLAAVVALAELLPWREREPRLTLEYVRRQQGYVGPSNMLGRERSPAEWCADRRLWTRWYFPHDADVDTLVAIVQNAQPLRREAAIECLQRHGAGASKALPVLARVLDEPEPAVLTTDRTVELHRKAARAVLAIAPASELATIAREVLAGKRAARRHAARELPERLRARIDQLVAELHAPATRAAAKANLVALGAAAAEPLAAVARPATDDDTVGAALAGLRELGAAAVAAVPELAEIATTIADDLRPDVLEVLIAAAPWAPDLVPHGLWWNEWRSGVRADAKNALQALAWRLDAAVRVDPRATLSELSAFCSDASAHVRMRALAVVTQRGDAARPMLPRLGEMLRDVLPPVVEGRFQDDGVSLLSNDYTPDVQRLAARAIVAIAPAGNHLLGEARAVLERPAPAK